MRTRLYNPEDQRVEPKIAAVPVVSARRAEDDAADDRATMRWLLSRLGPYKALVLLTYGISALVALAGAAALPVTEVMLAGLAELGHSGDTLDRTLVDRTIGRYFLGETPIHVVTVTALVLIGLKVLAGLLTYVHRYLTEALGARVGRDLRRDMFATLIHLGDDYYHRTQLGTILTRFGTDHLAVVTIYPQVVFGAPLTLVTLAITGVTVLLIDPWLGLLALATIPIFWLVLGPVSRLLQKRIQVWRKTVIATTEDVQETLSAIREVKAQSAEHREKEEFERTIGHQYDALDHYNALNIFAAQLTKSLTDTLPVVILVVGAFYVLSSPGTDAAVLVTIFTAVPPLLAAVGSLTGVRIAYISGVASARSIHRLVDERPETETIPGDRELVVPASWDPKEPVIVFDDVGFEYEGTGYSVRGVSFRAFAGQSIAVVGAGGSGKSTVLNILFKLRSYDRGSAKIFGQELRDLSIESVRRTFGSMPQFPFFFHRSVLDNILYGTDERGDAANDRARKLASQYELDGPIRAMSKGYDTVVTARGANFSGSQQKRLALCRALMRDPPILLLDEPLSGLSPDQSEQVIGNLAALRGEKLVVMITHELARLSDVDQVLVFERVENGDGTFGTIAEQGSPAELAARGRVFKKLLAERKAERGDA